MNKEHVYGRLEKYGLKVLEAFNHENLPLINLNSNLEIDDTNPCDNEKFCLENIIDFFTPYPLKSTCPLPLLTPCPVSESVYAGNDPGSHLMKYKTDLSSNTISIMYSDHKKYKSVDHDVKLLDAEHVYKKIRDVKTLQYRQTKQHVMIPKYLYEIALAYNEDPDLNLTGNYDHRYTGGCIDTIKLNGRSLLLSAYGSDCDKLSIVPIKRSSSTGVSGLRVKQDQTNIINLSDFDRIFQITATEHGETGLIGVRQKHLCRVLMCERKPKSSTKQIQYLYDNKNIFTNIALSPWYAYELVTIQRDRSVKLWDLHARNTKLVRKRIPVEGNKTLTHNWCGAHFSFNSPTSLYFADANSFRLIDLRVNDYSGSETLLNTKDISKYLFRCGENITVISNSLFKEYIQYVATTHQLLTFDIRMPGKIYQRWTHMLKGSPQFINTCCDLPDRELIFLANSEKSDIISIVNEWPCHDLGPISRVQPYLMENPYDTLIKAKLQGLCTDPRIQLRLKLGIMGICNIPSYKPVIISCNGAGDVFAQRLSPRFLAKSSEEATIEEESFTASMLYWQEQVQQVDKDFKKLNPPHPSRSNNAAHMGIIERICKSSNQPMKVEEIQRDNSYVLPLNQLYNSRDKLAKKLISAWNIQESDNINVSQLLPSQDELSAFNKVEDWLIRGNQTSQQTLSQETSTVTESQQTNFEFISVSQEIKKPTSSITSDLLLFSLRKKSVTKRRSRADGF